MNSSKTLRCTRMRDRAQQSWPALSKTAYGAAAAARSRSASANTMLALLPPSSSVTRFTCRAQPAMICWPTSVEPVKHDLARRAAMRRRTAGPTTEPLPGSTWNTPVRQARLAGELADPDRGQRRQLGRLEHRPCCRPRAPGAKPQPSDGHGEVPRHDQARPRRAARWNVTSTPPGTGICLTAQPLGRRRVVASGRRGRCRLPTGPCRSVCPLAGDLEPRQLLVMRRQPRRRSAAAARPARRAPPRARPPGRPPRGRSAASVSSADVS